MSVALTSNPATTSTRHDKLRVMVVDDSVVIRGMISRWIGAEPDMPPGHKWSQERLDTYSNWISDGFQP